MKRVSSIILLFITVTSIAGYFAYLTFSGRISPNPVSEAMVAAVRPYPSLSGPKVVKLTCSYHGQDLSISETLYQSLNTYYQGDPQKKSAFYHDRNAEMVMNYGADKTLEKITTKIQNLAKTNNLNSDQTLDLAACMLQSIPYDSAKAAKILSPDYYKLPVAEVLPRYPYETLYEGKGICTDKSYLGAAIFKRLGYSVSLLSFDSERHMSIGIEVPSGYGDFDTKYGIMELTGNGFLVGDIPEISASAGLAVGGVNTVPNVSTDSIMTRETSTALSTPSSTTVISGGSIYQRVVARMAVKSQLNTLSPELKSKQAYYLSTKEALVAAETELAEAENSYRSQPTSAKYGKYIKVYNSYLSIYNTAKAAVDDYNQLVNSYNALVAQYKSF